MQSSVHLDCNLDQLRYEDAEETDGDYIKNKLTVAAGDGLYYFSGDEENDGAMKTGTNVRIDLADGTYTFGFAKNGRAYNGENNKKIYMNGILLDGGDMRYDVAKFDGISYVVGPTGTYASNNSTVKDADDNYYALVDGKIYFVPADDYAARVARALVTVMKPDFELGSSTTYRESGSKSGYDLKVGTDEWVPITWEAEYTSSYAAK